MERAQAGARKKDIKLASLVSAPFPERGGKVPTFWPGGINSKKLYENVKNKNEC